MISIHYRYIMFTVVYAIKMKFFIWLTMFVSIEMIIYHNSFHSTFKHNPKSFFSQSFYPFAASVKIGRNSSTSTVHFHVGKNSFVSRKHLQVSFDRSSNSFYLMCLSKNGVFVNDVFQRKSSEPLKLPKTYVLSLATFKLNKEQNSSKNEKKKNETWNFNKCSHSLLFTDAFFDFRALIFAYNSKVMSIIRSKCQPKPVEPWKIQMWYMRHWKFQYQSMINVVRSHHQPVQ